jgi:hypothetical protein
VSSILKVAQLHAKNECRTYVVGTLVGIESVETSARSSATESIGISVVIRPYETDVNPNYRNVGFTPLYHVFPDGQIVKLPLNQVV